MRYTKQQKVKDLKALKWFLDERYNENKDTLTETKRLFLCFIIKENIKEFDPHFYGWFTDQLYLIDTKYKKFRQKTLVDSFRSTVSELFEDGLAVWPAFNYKDRLKFIDHLIESLS